MRAIFISYRRDDAEGEAGRLFDDLVKEFGEDSVFMDVAAIQVGRDFRKAIDESVATCGVLLAIIGRNWVDAKNEAGQRRLDDPFDFVRLETASALKRDIPLIPVLVHGARMPRADELPDDLKDLAYRNCCELTHARWSSDLQLLIKALRGVIPKTPAPVAPQPREDRPAPMPKPAKSKSRGVIVGVIIAALAVAAVLAYKLYTPAPAVSTASPGPATQPATVQVPAVKGMSRGVAERQLRAQGLAVGSVSKQPSATVARNIVLDQFPDAGRQADRGTRIDLVISDSVATPSPLPSSTAPSNPPKTVSPPKTIRQDLPNFAGKWEEFEITENGVPQKLGPAPAHVTLSQDGPLVRFLGRELEVSPAGVITYQTFFASDNGSGHAVADEQHADLVDTFTWRIENGTLIYETIFNYKRQYGNRAPGTQVRIVKYRRVAS